MNSPSILFVISLLHQLLTASAHLRHRSRMQCNAGVRKTAQLHFRIHLAADQSGAVCRQALQPDDFKRMPAIGKGVEEIRIRDDSGIYRVIYTARFADAVFVLHAFEKKTQRTSQHDIAIAKAPLSEMMRDRR